MIISLSNAKKWKEIMGNYCSLCESEFYTGKTDFCKGCKTEEGIMDMDKLINILEKKEVVL